MNENKRKQQIEIEHPRIREIDERTVHPGVEIEREQEFLQNTYDEYEVNQAQG
ncbi:hypothetical protein [Pseudalkalibacillus sp. SCS-8]|uniref:hypothetical protein n=1 Tax=Pseudalkalibacillus nanhaiensis TaxID=3115291 RepID=UPI0032DBECB2